ncbi:MAG TPA: chaperone modulator CbpM [Stellaceae bacterium]|nr:chaperone modulator CbpM [Stellaceae bacterium]
MMTFDELLDRYRGLKMGELRAWIAEGWVRPERSGESWRFAEVDVARVELILEIRREFAIDEEGLPLVLSLLDQVYALRRQMGRLCDVLAAQPSEVQAAIRQALRSAGEKKGRS